MGQNSKAKRDRKKRRKGKAPASAREYEQDFMKDLDFDSLDTIESGEEDMVVECNHCGHVALMPVEAWVVPVRMVPPGESIVIGELTMGCVECHEPYSYFPRPEWDEGGESLLLWRDRTVIKEFEGEYHPKTVLQAHVTNRRTGEKSIITAGSMGEAWAYCETCNLPFRFRGSMAWTSLTGGPAVNLHVGPCTHCEGDGGPALLEEFSSSGMTTVSASPSFAETIGLMLEAQSQGGELDLTAAVTVLRQTKNPTLSAVADWLEARPVSAMIAATTLQVAATLIAPVILSPAPNAVPTSQFTDQQIREILDSIMSQYDAELPKRGQERRGRHHDEPPGRQGARRD